MALGGLLLVGAGFAKQADVAVTTKDNTPVTVTETPVTSPSAGATTEPTTTVIANGTYALAIDKSVVSWGGLRLDGDHRVGTLKLAEGSVTAAGGQLTAGTFTIDMNSLAESGHNAGVEKHLKSDDFFGVGKYPTAVFTLTKPVEIDESGSGTVTGNLQLHGMTKEISFPSLVKVVGGELTAVANFNLDRTLWNVKYGSGKFFKSLGNKLIKDDMEVGLRLFAAVKK